MCLIYGSLFVPIRRFHHERIYYYTPAKEELFFIAESNILDLISHINNEQWGTGMDYWLPSLPATPEICGSISAWRRIFSHECNAGIISNFLSSTDM